MEKLALELKSKQHDVRVKAAEQLKDFVKWTSREQSGEALSKFMNDVNRIIFELIHSNDNNDKLGGILAIDKLIDNEGEEDPTKVTRFANYLRIVLPGNDFQITELAAKALGRLAAPGGTLTSEFVEFEVKRALEWLQGDRLESRRYAAVLVLKELALNSSTLIYSYVPQILDLIWIPLRDPKVSIREGAAEGLCACLSLVQVRENQLRRQLYKKLFEEVQKGLKPGNSPEVIHGALLALKEVAVHTMTASDWRFKEICELVFKFKDHRDALVRKTTINMIPTMAELDPESFYKESFLNLSIAYLVSQLKKEKERSFAFVAIGRVAVAMESRILPFLDVILQNVKEGLAIKIKSKASLEISIFQCISNLAIAVGPALSKHMHDILDFMFSGGISAALIQALEDLSLHIPPLAHTIRVRLLNLLSTLLVGHAYHHPGAPPPPTTLVGQSKDGTNDARDSEMIILALETLGSFDFNGILLSDILRDVAANYLDDDFLYIKRAAAITCCCILSKDPISFQSSDASLTLVGDVVNRLLILGVADCDSNLRLCVLNSLGESLDTHLAHAEPIHSLFLAINDEVFAIREVAVRIIGRLSLINPAYILPPLRRLLIKLLTEIEYCEVSIQKEQSARLICQLISSSQSLVVPYMDSIIKVLLPKTRDPSPVVASQVITALGQMSLVGAKDIIPYLDEIMSVIIDTLQDQSSPLKRESALVTLAQISGNTGMVIEPYIKYPSLLNLLIKILKTEQSPSIRRETVKVIGVLGALDPYKYQTTNTIEGESSPSSEVSSLPLGVVPSSDEYYPTIVISSLMKILKDPSLSSNHTDVVSAIMFIFKTLGLKCVPFMSQIMPPFLAVMRTCPTGKLQFYFQQLALIVSIVKQHIRNYLNEIISLVQDFWSINPNLQATSLSLIEAIAQALDGEFKIYLPLLLPQILQIFETDSSEKRHPTQKLLNALVNFGPALEEYLHLIIPPLVRLFEKPDAPTSIRKQGILVSGYLSKQVTFCDQASRVVHPLIRMLPFPEFRNECMDTLARIVYQMGPEFNIFIPTLSKMIAKYHIHHQKYEMLISRLLRDESFPFDDAFFGDVTGISNVFEDTLIESSSKKLPVNQQQLKKAWETSQRYTRDDWLEWIRRFSVELLKESPSHALRACSTLASAYNPLARELFNAAFLSCWGELYDQFQDELVRSLETALTSINIPPEILQTLLNLAEFMEHDDKALPIDIRTLGLYAAKCHAYAKALHYKELEFISEPLTNNIEALISINNQLQQPDSAIGILTYAQQNHDVELKESWYEKLQRWDDGLAAYERKQLEDPSSFEAVLGRMRCLHNLGEWERLSSLAQEKWVVAKEDVKRAIAPLAAAAAWGLGEWSMMDDYILYMKQDSPDSAFFKAILFLHKNLFPQAMTFIEKTRELLDTELIALIGESYNRAYNVVVRIQMLSELEEIITYKQSFSNPEKQVKIHKTWISRIQGCQRNVEVWQRILKVRALIIPPKDDMMTWIKFANLCRKSGRFSLAHKSLSGLLAHQNRDLAQLDTSCNPPLVVYACLKYLWASGSTEQSFIKMQEFTQGLVSRLDISSVTNLATQIEGISDPCQVELLQVLARCYLKLGEWQIALKEELKKDIIPEILRNYQSATLCDKDWYKAWHAWALANFEVLGFYEKNSETPLSHELVLSLVIPSVQGFFRSIALSKGNSLQDTLRLLTLWFKYGHYNEVNMTIGESFNSISIDTWLEVIPQLIARIHSSGPQKRLVHQLLSNVGKEHPQAIVYSLTVASKSQSISRRKAALAILDRMRSHSLKLVEQALLVSQELIRVAILWHEMWHEGLEEASRLYYGDHNIEGMFTVLEPLHQILEKGPETLREISFQQAFGRDLQEAQEWCKKYKRTLNVDDLNQAWDLYYQVFRRITKQLPQLTTLELQYVSPKLLDASDLELAIPGSYKSGDPIVHIVSFNPTLSVMTSKQRPRRLNIKGSDGKEYQYLLKGHEDLRQDERVMQLFGLVNTLLSTDSETFKRHLNIHRYPVIPLSPNSGLIGWVPACDTLHALIRDFRESRKILLNIEHRLMLQMAPDYDNLTLLQKVEVFEYALENTTGQDLYKVLWLKSKNSETWLERRTNYTQSLAVMSMVGYILGLGDRHPSNLMLERNTGKVIHIDFGDCFEVAMNREKFPEKIPFRLTRMLINAMEVSGIEGTFRITCENVMRVIRENKESLMAVLEAFVYDPLINWRLLTTASPKQPVPAQSTSDKPNKIDMFPSTAVRKQKNENELIVSGDEGMKPEALNARALVVMNRVSNKLTGKDFKPNMTLDVPLQVQRLILQATSLENLSQCYIGWCAFW